MTELSVSTSMLHICFIVTNYKAECAITHDFEIRQIT